MKQLIAILLACAAPAYAARHTQDFETFDPGNCPIAYTQGSTTVVITGAAIADVSPGPYGFGQRSLTSLGPECDGDVLQPIRIDFYPPVYEVSFYVTSTLGFEDDPPVCTCWSTGSYRLVWKTGPGIKYPVWLHNRYMVVGAGYYQIGGSDLAGVITYCTFSGDADNVSFVE